MKFGNFGKTTPRTQERPREPAASTTDTTRRIVVMNSKGGCGKTTIATNLASCYRARGFTPTLYDLDPQASGERWARLRPEENGAIATVAGYRNVSSGVTRAWQYRIPAGTDRIILDTPAGTRRMELAEQVRGVDAILIPVMPSSIDTQAAADFIRDLLLAGKTRSRGIRVGIIANRVKEGTRAVHSLERFLETLQIPMVAQLRDTQNYVHAAEQGLGVHELFQSRTRKDLLAWQRILDWLEAERPEALASYRL